MVQQGAVTIIAEFECEATNLNKILALLKEMRVKSLEEEDCLQYKIYQLSDNPNTIVLIEVYRNEVGLQAHKESKHYQEIIAEKVRPLLTKRTVKQITPLYI
jgi:quinol monooxygenase YgiN